MSPALENGAVQDYQARLHAEGAPAVTERPEEGMYYVRRVCRWKWRWSQN